MVDDPKTALVNTLAQERAVVLQACWARLLGQSIKTASGQTLQVAFPGRLNRGPGPDFMGARLRLDGQELEGDVEIHTGEGDWLSHGHSSPPDFNKVVLQVVAKRGAQPAAQEPPKRPIPVLELASCLPLPWMEGLADPGQLLLNYPQLPGLCGLKAFNTQEEALQKLIGKAAEKRAQEKAARIAAHWRKGEEEQELFKAVFRALGYRHYAELFESLAQAYPLASLAPLMELPYRRARTAVLCRWFGLLGLLESPLCPKEAPPELAREYQDMRMNWLALERRPALNGWRRGGRPWNSPERRLVGFFHHLYPMSQKGWLKSWLGLLLALDQIRDGSALKKKAAALLDEAFATPDWEVWRRMVAFHTAPLSKEARLIGADRIMVAMANAVIPFFLALARSRKDGELEKLIYRLFLVLPPEESNQKIRFMEARLLPLAHGPASLRRQQGLLQIYQDYCGKFEDGCRDCSLPELIKTRD